MKYYDKKWIQLLNKYNFACDMQFYEMIIDSFLNGQREQAISQFKELPKQARKKMVVATMTTWQSGIIQSDLLTLIKEI